MTAAPRVLVVSDDTQISQLLDHDLRERGFEVFTAGDIRGCVDMLESESPDLVVLDIVLPDGSGLDLCRELRRRKNHIPIILLGALREDTGCILGLEREADDYVGKPFEPRELADRIQTVLWRTSNRRLLQSRGKYYQVGCCIVDPQRRRVTTGNGNIIDLSQAEFDLFLAFIKRPGRTLSRDELLALHQNFDSDRTKRSIDILVSRMRRKLENETTAPMFRTVRRRGYQLVAPVTSFDLS
ncbi:response regulator transcription factor [Rhizobium rhizogenes]|uniref:response regulator transcription factor n=1 Tax=Rhizobium rhizogenes TaxID=359 RepID=UPI0015718955|nr:response regulator transcription factor [Rhizobium rhizogenes]NTI32920.1 response regulator transcription factor [Rhizobium rhizogenes]